MNSVGTRTFLGDFSIAARSLLAGATIAAAAFVSAPAYAETDGNPLVTPVSEPQAEPAKGNKAEGDRSSTKRAYLGRAPWICTPSGFGKTARCFQRSSYN